MSSNTLEDEFYERLVAIRKEQLECPERDRSSLLSFMEHLTEVHNLAKRVMAQTSLTARANQLLRTITLSNIVAPNMILKLGDIGRDLEEGKNMEIEAALAKLSLNDSKSEQASSSKLDRDRTPSPGAPSSLKLEADSDAVDKAPARSVMREARDWALEHLYKPYPSKKAKETLANQLNVSEDHVSTWFTQLRRRIGWNQIVKKHFKGNKALTVDAARFVFFEGKVAEQRVGKPVCEALLAMKETAETILKPPTLTEIEERIDRLANEAGQSATYLPDSYPSSTPGFSSPDALKSPETASPKQISLKGIKRRSDEDAAPLDRRVKRCRRFEVTSRLCTKTNVCWFLDIESSHIRQT